MSYELRAVPKPGVAEKDRPRKGLKRSRMKSRGPRTKKSGGALFPKGVNEDYRQWIRFKPCILGMRMRYAGGEEKFENCEYILQHVCNSAVRGCHVKSRGSGGKDVGNMYPGCDSAHDEQHRIGIRAFEKRWQLNLRNVAEGLAFEYEHYRGGSLAPTHPQGHP